MLSFSLKRPLLLFTSLFIYSVSQEKKNRYAVRARVGGWRARLVSCLQTGLGSRQPKPPWWQKSCTNSIVSALGVASVPAGEHPWTEGERGLALCHAWYCTFGNGRKLCLAFDGLASWSLRTRAAGGGVGVLCPQRCVWTWSAACRISSLATGGWEWLRGHSFLVAFLGDHPDCRVFWPLVNIDSLF